MSDISEARQRIRDLVIPLKRDLLSYHIEETLGKSDRPGGVWNDDALVVTIELYVTPAKDYPWGEYEDGDSHFIASFTSGRADAIAKMYEQVELKCPEWRRALDLDNAFSKSVGRKVRIVRVLKEFVINQDDERKQQGLEQREQVTLKPGTLLDVVAHGPGKLIIQLDTKQFEIYFWKFTNYTFTRGEFGKKEPDQRFPAQYLEFADGFTPWSESGDTST